MPPVIVTIKFALLPAHNVLAPDTLNTAAVGEGFTVTSALPLPATEQPAASVTLPTMAYVVVAAGFTGIGVPLT